MPAKGNKRGRKHKGTSHVATAAAPVKVLAKPASHTPVDYAKWDRLEDSEDDSDHDHAYMPAELGLGDVAMGGKDVDLPCACDHCRQRAEAADRAAAAAAKQQSSSSKSVAAHTSSQSEFDFGKAFRSESAFINQSVKAALAEGKAKCTHGVEDGTVSVGGNKGIDDALVTVHKQSDAAKTGNKAGHSKSPKRITSPEQSDLVLRPTFDTCYSFVQTHLPSHGFSDRVLCNVLEKLNLSKMRNPNEEPAAALMRTFVELRIDLDPQDLVDYARQCSRSRKHQRKSKEADKLGQPPVVPKQRPEAPASRPGHAHLPDPAGFHALMAKQGLSNKDMTFSFTPLMAKAIDEAHVQLSPQRSHIHPEPDSSGESTPYESPSEDDDEEMPPLVDIDRDIGFGPARFPISSFGNTSASSRAAPPTPAAKQPAAPNLSAQSSAGRSSKKSARKPAAAASKPSLVRSAGKAPARVSPPQHVTTISDDEDDDEPIPGLVSSEDNSEGGTDSDSGEGFDLDDDDEEVPYLLTSSDDEAHSSAAEANAKPARHGTRAHFNGLRHPPNGALPKQPTPSPAPSRSTAKGKAAPSAAFAEPVSRPAEKGAQAQQATGSAQGGSTSHSIPGVNDRGPKTGHKETGGTPFSFGRAVGGGKAQAADANSTAGAGSKAGSSLPASQHPAYPFPQFETPEEYKADMGFGELRHGEVASSSGSDSSYVYTEPHFNPVTGNRKKTSVSASSLDTHEQLQLERERAADEAMKQLLEEEERDKAEAALKAEKAKGEKQKTKKAKQKAKKKGQQDKAAGKLAQAASSSAAQPWKSSQADSSQSEEEEERERFSLQDSRFASLVGDTTPSAGPGGSGVGDPNPSLGQGLQRLQPSSTHATAAGSTAADSGNEEEGKDNTMMQFGGGFAMLHTLGRGPPSEKSQSSQDTQSSSRLPAVPVLKPGESPLQLSQTKHAAQKAVPEGQAGSSNQGSETRPLPLGIRPGVKPGMYPTLQSPVPQGVNPSQPGPSLAAPLGTAPAQLGTAPSPDPDMSLVLEACQGVVLEMEQAGGAGDRGRLQEALKGAVMWLSQNGSNPDVAANSAQVRRALHEAKAKLKLLGRPAAPLAPPGLAPVPPPGLAPHCPGLRQFAVSSAAPAASRITEPSVNMPAGREQALGGASRQALLDLASEARLHPFRAVHPPTPPPRAGQPPPPPPPRVPPSAAGVHPQAPAQPRPYLQPYQPPPGGIRPNGVQGTQGPYRQPLPHQAPYPQEQYRQPYPDGLEPYRPVQGGRGAGPNAGRGGRSANIGPGQMQSSMSGSQQSAALSQENRYSRYGRIHRAGLEPRPPAMPIHLPQPGSSHATSAYGSDYGSLDRSSLDGSEATSPVKSAKARHEAKPKYVQPTPFGIREQPSFDEHDDTDCVVCMDDVRCTVFVPCGHCLCCQSCAETVVQKYKHCPVCSTAVDGFCATRL